MSKNKTTGKALAKSVDMPMEKDPSMADHETRGHLNTLTDAMDIMGDKDKMHRVKKLVGRHTKAIKSLADLKDHANNFSNDHDEDDMKS